MGRVKRGGSSMMQRAYAMRIWGGRDRDKKSIALDVGYSPAVAESPKSKIEIHKGFHNAMAALAEESNNIALKILYEFKTRNMTDFSNKDLIGALNAIGQAWGKFNAGALKMGQQDAEALGKNRLRTIILQRVENQTISSPEVATQTTSNVVESVKEEDF
jgi:hypothetical protein